MNTDLIDDQTLEAIPDGDPGYAFVLFERACRTSLFEMIEREDNGNVISNLQLDYMHDVVAAAQHFEITDLKDFKLPSARNFNYDVWQDFNR